MTSPKDALPIVTSSSFPFSVTPPPVPKVLFVFGTRPEAIKLCPLVRELRDGAYSRSLETLVCVTGQHREMLHPVLEAFRVKADHDLAVMQPGQSLGSLTGCLMTALDRLIHNVQPSLVIVQGDTTSTLCGALAAFYAHAPVAHVEAGLRTHDLQSPFPEELNRVLTSRVASLHFAATPWGAENLVKEGVDPASILVTGNTGIDAVLSVSAGLESGALPASRVNVPAARRLILVTAHRRESFGLGFERICEAIRRIADREDVHVVWPVHLNPRVRATVFGRLENHKNISFLEPLDYVPFVDLMRRATLLITDSGGIQEEGPSLGKPILVMREKTERPEAVNAGTVKLVGTDTALIVREAERLLDHPAEYERMARLHNPYGDGHACSRIAERISSFLKQGDSATREKIGD